MWPKLPAVWQSAASVPTRSTMRRSNCGPTPRQAATGSYSIVGVPPSTYEVVFTACLGGSDPYPTVYAPYAPGVTPGGVYTVNANPTTTVNDTKI